MQHISEFMTRDPNDDERTIIGRIVEMATDWRNGDITLEQVKTRCSGYERFQSIRFLPRSSPEKRLVQSLVEHLTIDVPMGGPRFRVVDYGTEPIEQEPINLAAGEADVAPLWLSPAEMAEAGYKLVNNYDGKRVWVSPLYWMNDEPKYPPFHLPPGEERRKVEAAMNLAYTEYRRKKKGGR